MGTRGIVLGRMGGSDVVRRKGTQPGLQGGVWEKSRGQVCLEHSRPGHAQGMAAVGWRDRGGSQVSISYRVTLSPSFGNEAQAQDDSERVKG